MTKIVKLTNTVDDLKGSPIYINADHITSIYQMPREEGGSLITVIYGGPKGEAWNVEESPEEIVKLINK